MLQVAVRHTLSMNSPKILYSYLKQDAHACADLGVESCTYFLELIIGHGVPSVQHFLFHR
jgi:hypothetical protein